MKSRILIYDFIIVIIFLPLTLIAVAAQGSFLCDCFASRFGPIINVALGLLFVVGLCFLNHSKNKKESVTKWYSFPIYVIVAIVFFLLLNLGIVKLNDVINIGGNSSF